MRIFLFLFFISSLGFSQNPGDSEYFHSSLSAGEIFSLDGISLKFKEVISDSRCPKGTTCVLAGEAKVKVEVYKNGDLLKEKVIALGQGANLPVDLFGDASFLVSKFRLSPYPKVSEKIKPSDYRLYMEVSRSEEI